MNAFRQSSRWITTGLIATTVLSLATPAFAGRRYKKVYPAVPAQQVVVHQHSSSAGPVIAGIVGGFILGSALASSHPVVVHEPVYAHPIAVYRYYDPYDRIWFDSLDQCSYAYYRGHGRVIHVIDVSSGRHVRTLRYGDGHWYRVAGGYSRHYHEDCD